MVKATRRRFIQAGALAGTGITGFAGCIGDDGEVPEFDIEWVVPVELMASLWDVEELREELTHYGEEYTVTSTNSSSTPDSVSSMAAGEADIVTVSTLSWASAVTEDAVPGGMTAIAMDFWDAHPDHYGFTIYANPETEIEAIPDLKGTRIGVNATGTGTHAIIRAGLREAGLSEDDVDIIEQDFPTFPAAIGDGTFESGIFPAFFGPAAREQGFTPVFSSHDIWTDPYPFAWLVASNETLEEYPDAIRAWGEDFVELFDIAVENRDDYVPTLAENFEVPEEMVDAFWFTEHDFFKAEPVIDTDALQDIMDDMVELDFLEESFDVSDHVTDEYIA